MAVRHVHANGHADLTCDLQLTPDRKPEEQFELARRAVAAKPPQRVTRERRIVRGHRHRPGATRKTVDDREKTFPHVDVQVWIAPLPFHDAHAHSDHRPPDAHAAALYDLLEHARLDAIGARWLAGVARNLTAHPGLDDDGLRWLAFETFSGTPAPREKSPLAAAVARRLPASLVARLSDLGRHRDDPPAFAAAAAAWIADAGRLVPASQASTGGPASVPLPKRDPRLRQLPKRGDPGGTKAPLRRDRQGGDTSGDTASAGAQVDSTGAPGVYRAYTTAYDRVVNALTLATRAELVELHTRLETELSAARTVVARLAKRLMRVLMARQTREWAFDLDEGVLDGSRLARLVAGGRARPFKQESDSPFPSTVVSLLIFVYSNGYMEHDHGFARFFTWEPRR